MQETLVSAFIGLSWLSTQRYQNPGTSLQLLGIWALSTGSQSRRLGCRHILTLLPLCPRCS